MKKNNVNYRIIFRILLLIMIFIMVFGIYITIKNYQSFQNVSSELQLWEKAEDEVRKILK